MNAPETCLFVQQPIPQQMKKQEKQITHEVDWKSAHKKTTTFGSGYGFARAFANMHAVGCQMTNTHSSKDSHYTVDSL